MIRTPTTSGARRTRERVLEAALELFNERSSAAVTTNHVAARAGISPGNLYYWFANKDEIIRELFAGFARAYEGLWEMGDGGPILSPDDLVGRLADGAEHSRRYAFLGRDLFGLLHADPELATRYRAVRASRRAAFTALARAWRTQGVIRPIDDRTIADLVEVLWVVAETWLAFAEIDRGDPEADDGARLLRVVLAPYLATDGPVDAARVASSDAVPS